MAKSTPRFLKIDFSDAVIVPWEPDHLLYGKGFQCRRSEFQSHYKKRVPRDVKKYLGKCWIIAENKKLVGYITLLADKLKIEGGTRTQKLLKKEDVIYTSFPAVKIGILAVDERTRGAGTALMDWAIYYIAKEINPRLGVRFVTVDALYDKEAKPQYDISAFYEKFGFRFANPKQRIPPKDGIRTMYYDLKDLLDRQG